MSDLPKVVINQRVTKVTRIAPTPFKVSRIAAGGSGGKWGFIAGNIGDQTDLQTAFSNSEAGTRSDVLSQVAANYTNNDNLTAQLSSKQDLSPNLSSVASLDLSSSSDLFLRVNTTGDGFELANPDAPPLLDGGNF